MGKVTNDRIEIADREYDCNAYMYLTECIEDAVEDMTFSEKRAWVKARQNSGKIKVGDQMRVYEWEEYSDEEAEHYNLPSSRETIHEMPKIAAILTRLKLWP